MSSVELRPLVHVMVRQRMDLKEFFGIVFPTKRRIFARQPDGRCVPGPLVVSIDLDKFVLF